MAAEERAPKGTPRAVFGGMMRFYREQGELTREDLSGRIHMSAATIGSYENGWRVPLRDNVVLIDDVPEMQTNGALTKLWTSSRRWAAHDGAKVNRLIEAARQPRIRIEVISIGTGAHEGLFNGAFVLADLEDKPTVACRDTNIAPQFLRNRQDVAELGLVWTTIRGEALPRGASLALFEEAAKTCSFSL